MSRLERIRHLVYEDRFREAFSLVSDALSFSYVMAHQLDVSCPGTGCDWPASGSDFSGDSERSLAPPGSGYTTPLMSESDGSGRGFPSAVGGSGSGCGQGRINGTPGSLTMGDRFPMRHWES